MIRQHVNATTLFQLSVYKADGTLKSTGSKFRNIILNTGLDLMGEKSYLTHVAVGTGNSEPNVNQTGLDALFAYTNTDAGSATVTYEALPTPRYKRVFRKRFASGTFNNTILSEIALGSALDASGKDPVRFTAWNRALIKDALGNPTTITLLSDEFLEVTATVYYYPVMDDVVSTIEIVDKGVVTSTHNILVRPARLGETTFDRADGRVTPVYQEDGSFELRMGSIGIVTAAPTGSLLGTPDNYGYHTIATNFDYVKGSYRRTGQVHFPLDYGNGSTSAIYAKTSLGAYQASITPPMLKTSSQLLTVYVTVSWGRYEGAIA